MVRAVALHPKSKALLNPKLPPKNACTAAMYNIRKNRESKPTLYRNVGGKPHEPYKATQSKKESLQCPEPQTLNTKPQTPTPQTLIPTPSARNPRKAFNTNLQVRHRGRPQRGGRSQRPVHRPPAPFLGFREAG